MTTEQVLNLIRGRIGNGRQVEIAKLWGISPSYLCDVLKGQREPGEKILKPLGLERKINYVRIRP